MAAEKTQEIKWTKRKQCAAMNCNNYQCTSSECAFHRFPKDPQRCAKWVHNLKNASLYAITSDQLHRTYRVCSAHFHISQFKRPSDVHAGLKWDAVPTEIDAPDPPPPLDVKKRKPPKTHQELLCKKSKQSHVPPPSKEQYTEEAVAGPSSVEEGDVEDVLAEPSSVHTAAVGEQSHTMKISALKTQVSSQEPIMKYKEKSLCSLMNIKDEPTDEDYDKALIPQSDISVKEDPENEDHETLVPDELRITSVFSVEGDSDVSGLTSAATAAQAPLSLSKDMPVIGGVVSLASALSGNTALTDVQRNTIFDSTMANKFYTAAEDLALPFTDDCDSERGELEEDIETESEDSPEHCTSDEELFHPPKKMRFQAEEKTTGVRAKDGTWWETVDAGRLCGELTSTSLKFKEKAGPSEHAKRKITSRLQSFLCMFDTEMLMVITDCTVHEARRTDDSWSLSVSELMAFIAILFLRAALCQVGAMSDSWCKKYPVAPIQETMSRDRYGEIMRYLRFDDKSTRAERVKTDKFAAVSDIWQCFVRNCQLCYVPGQHITVNEKLFPTKVRCPFTHYIATKPDKFGIKFWIAVDLETKYVCNAMPYLGKDPSRPKGERLSDNVVVKLMGPFLGKGRTVTVDNFFTSMALASRLLNHSTTLLGTMNTIRRETPPPAKNSKGRKELSTDVYRSGSAILTVYAPKKNKAVCVLSTMHQHVEVADGPKRKPNTITDYNRLKCGVDIMNQMVRLYSVRAGTRRWPVAVFYNMLDLAALNAYVLFKACTGSTESRRDFILCLAEELRQHFLLEKAMVKKHLPPSPSLSPVRALPPGKKTQCQVRKHCNRNHSTRRCAHCHRYTCRKCKKDEPWVCGDC